MSSSAALAAGGTVHLVIGPERHGVVLHALRVAAAGRGEVIRTPEPARYQGRPVVMHFTDRAFGPDAATAAERAVAWLAPAGRTTVVLHDLPQASDGHHRQVRTQAYARVALAADRVVVSSRHEQRLARALPGVDADRLLILPLPVERAPGVPGRLGCANFSGSWVDQRATADQAPVDPLWPTDRPWFGVLGFIYPGKGLQELIDAAAGCPRPPGVPAPGVLALGGASKGHEDLESSLRQRATLRGVPLTITGWLSDTAMERAIDAVDVPVVAHQHMSASGSVNSWLTRGRRPVALASDYLQEQNERLPEALRLVHTPSHDDVIAPLRTALAQALTDPASTWLDPALELGPGWAEVAHTLETDQEARR